MLEKRERCTENSCVRGTSRLKVEEILQVESKNTVLLQALLISAIKHLQNLRHNTCVRTNSGKNIQQSV